MWRVDLLRRLDKTGDPESESVPANVQVNYTSQSQVLEIGLPTGTVAYGSPRPVTNFALTLHHYCRASASFRSRFSLVASMITTAVALVICVVAGLYPARRSDEGVREALE